MNRSGKQEGEGRKENTLTFSHNFSMGVGKANKSILNIIYT